MFLAIFWLTDIYLWEHSMILHYLFLQADILKA